MRFFVTVIIIAVLSASAEFLLPWWMIAVVPFLVSLFAQQRPGRAFLAGFLGVGLCWLTAAFLQDAANEHILSVRMAQIFQLPNYGVFIAVVVFIGALIGGMAACAGALIKTQR